MTEPEIDPKGLLLRHPEIRESVSCLVTLAEQHRWLLPQIIELAMAMGILSAAYQQSRETSTPFRRTLSPFSWRI